jgi:hypothetical protein
MSYYNTTHSTGSQLAAYKGSAKAQETYILKIFQNNVGYAFTPSEIRSKFIAVVQADIPITSIRRAITNLTNYGDLEKTSKQKTGPYGRPEYLWRLKTTQLSKSEQLIKRLLG